MTDSEGPHLLVSSGAVIAAILFSLVVGTAFASATTTTTTTKFDVQLFAFVPCANGGAGEVVELTGSLNDVFKVTDTGNGQFILKVHDNPQGVVGIGLTTGDVYRGTGATRFGDVLAAGETFSFVNNFRIIGQGTGNNLLVHENFHITVNPDGTLTSFHDNFSFKCK